MHLTRSSIALIAAAAFGAAALPAQSVQAAVLAQDNFDSYSTGSPVGQTPPAGSPFTGFTQADGSAGAVVSGDLGGGAGQHLSIPVQTTAGGGGVTGVISGALDVSPTGPFSAYLDGSGKIGKDNTTLYVSLTFKVTGTEGNPSNPHNEGTVTFSGGDSSFFVGKRYNYPQYQTNAGSGAAAKDLGSYDEQTHQLILRIDFQAGAEQITSWLDPNTALGETDAGQVTPVVLNSQSSISFSKLDFKARVTGGNSIPAEAAFDRVVFSDSFQSAAIPEPSSALLGLGVGGLLLARRRRGSRAGC